MCVCVCVCVCAHVLGWKRKQRALLCWFKPAFLPEEVETTEPAKEWRASLAGRKEPPAGPPASGGHAEGDGGLESLQIEKKKAPGFRGKSCSRGRWADASRGGLRCD